MPTFSTLFCTSNYFHFYLSLPAYFSLSSFPCILSLFTSAFLLLSSFSVSIHSSILQLPQWNSALRISFSRTKNSSQHRGSGNICAKATNQVAFLNEKKKIRKKKERKFPKGDSFEILFLEGLTCFECFEVSVLFGVVL